MENFSTVLWIVVIAAAMIFNVVSQSRKQAKKQARQAGDRHAGSEAWPSWDPAAAPQPAPRKDAPVRQEVQPAVVICALTLSRSLKSANFTPPIRGSKGSL